MEVKAGYQQTEVGDIPEEWDAVRLCEVADLQVGFAFKSEWFGDAVGTRLLRGENVGYGKADWSETRTLKTKTDSTFRTYLLNPGDIVIGMDRTFTKTGSKMTVLCEDDCPCLLVQRVGRLIPRGCDNRFLWFVLSSDAVQSRLQFEQKGMDIPHLSRTEILRPMAAFPPLAEQRAIAAALSDVDALLGGLDRLIAKKRDLKQAAMQQLLTGQTRLPGFRGEWRLMRLCELCDYVDGIVTLGGDLGYLEIGDVNVESRSYDVAQKEKLSVRGAVKVPSGTLLISTVRPTRGAIVITRSALYVSSAFCRVRPVNGLLFHLVCQPTFLAYLGENSIGGTYPTCRDETILEYESVLPSDPAEQAAIAAVLSDMDAEIAALEARRDKTRDLKQAMMQELLTGRTRLLTLEEGN